MELLSTTLLFALFFQPLDGKLDAHGNLDAFEVAALRLRVSCLKLGMDMQTVDRVLGVRKRPIPGLINLCRVGHVYFFGGDCLLSVTFDQRNNHRSWKLDGAGLSRANKVISEMPINGDSRK